MNKKLALEILGLSDESNIYDIKKAYRSLIKRYHPDTSSPEKSEEKTVELIKAFDFLTKPSFSEDSNITEEFMKEDFIFEHEYEYSSISGMKKQYAELRELWQKQQNDPSFQNSFKLIYAALKLNTPSFIENLLTKPELINSCFLAENYLPINETFYFLKLWDQKLQRMEKHFSVIDLFFAKLKCKKLSNNFPYIGSLLWAFEGIGRNDLAIEFLERALEIGSSKNIEAMFEMIDLKAGYIISEEIRYKLKENLLKLYRAQIKELKKNKKLDHAIEFAKKAALVADNSDYQKLLIKLLFEASKLAEAEVELNNATIKFGHIIGVDKIYKAFSCSTKDKKSNPDLIKKLEKKISAPNPMVEDFIRLSNALINIGKIKEAEEYVKKAYYLNPRNERLNKLIAKHNFNLPKYDSVDLPDLFQMARAFQERKFDWLKDDFFIENICLSDQKQYWPQISLMFQITATVKPENSFKFLKRNFMANTIFSIKSSLIEAMMLLDDNEVHGFLLESQLKNHHFARNDHNAMFLLHLDDAISYFLQKKSRKKITSEKQFSEKKTIEQIAILEKIIYSNEAGNSIEEDSAIKAKQNESLDKSLKSSTSIVKVEKQLSQRNKFFLNKTKDEIVFDYLLLADRKLFDSFIIANKFLKAFPKPAEIFGLDTIQIFSKIFTHYLKYYCRWEFLSHKVFYNQLEAFLGCMKKILHESDNIEVISMCLNNLGMLLSKTGDKEKCFRCYKAISEIHPNSYHIQNIPLRGNNLNKFFEEFVDENQSGQREMIDLLFNFTASVEHEIERIKTEILGRQLK